MDFSGAIWSFGNFLCVDTNPIRVYFYHNNDSHKVLGFILAVYLTYYDGGSYFISLGFLLLFNRETYILKKYIKSNEINNSIQVYFILEDNKI